MPRADQLPERLSSVFAVVYLIFNEGYAPTAGDRLVRPALCDESIRLARGLAELMPAEPEVLGLLALMLLADSRRAARVSSDGALVPLATQDRSRWDRLRIAEGQAIVRQCLHWNRPGPYQIQAAIQAVHSDAPAPGATDWRQVVALYDQLLVLAPTPVVALNRATALAEFAGPEAGLRALDGVALDGYHLLHAVRGDLLQRAGRPAEARAAVNRAIELCGKLMSSANCSNGGGGPYPRRRTDLESLPRSAPSRRTCLVSSSRTCLDVTRSDLRSGAGGLDQARAMH